MVRARMFICADLVAAGRSAHGTCSDECHRLGGRHRGGRHSDQRVRQQQQNIVAAIQERRNDGGEHLGRASPDYSALLIQPNDLGGDFTAPDPPVLNFNNTTGVAQLFVNADNSRRIGDTILIVDNPAVAAAGLENTKTNYAKKVAGTWQPVDVGSNGAMISGTSPDNSQSITVLLFTEGRALVNLEFDGAPGDPIDPGLATDIGRKQDAAVKNGLHS